MSDKIAWYRSYWFIAIIGCLALLAVGMLGINRLQSTLTARAEAALFSNTYISLQAQGPKLEKISVHEFPQTLWLNYDAKFPTDCQVTATVVFRRYEKHGTTEFFEVLPIESARVEARSLKTDNIIRHVSFLVEPTAGARSTISPGHYQITRLSRFQCGTKDRSNITTWQVADFEITS